MLVSALPALHLETGRPMQIEILEKVGCVATTAVISI